MIHNNRSSMFFILVLTHSPCSSWHLSSFDNQCLWIVLRNLFNSGSDTLKSLKLVLWDVLVLLELSFLFLCSRVILLVVWVYLAKLHCSIQTGGLFTRESILRMVASQCLLVKHGGVPAEETPLGSFNYLTFIVLYGKTDVKNLQYWRVIDPPSSPLFYLAAAVHIGIIPVCLAFTTKTVHIRISKNFFVSCREDARPLLLWEDQP